MKTITVRIPDRLADEMAAFVEAGAFTGDEDVALSALRDFVRRNRLDLQDQYQQEDIAWAIQQRQDSRF